MDSFSTQDVAQVVNLLLSKLTLFEFNDPLIFGQKNQHCSKMTDVLLISITIYQDIVKKYYNTLSESGQVEFIAP